MRTLVLLHLRTPVLSTARALICRPHRDEGTLRFQLKFPKTTKNSAEKWTQDLTDCLCGLMNRDIAARIQTVSALSATKLCSDLDFVVLAAKQMSPPFVPETGVLYVYFDPLAPPQCLYLARARLVRRTTPALTIHLCCAHLTPPAVDLSYRRYIDDAAELVKNTAISTDKEPAGGGGEEEGYQMPGARRRRESTGECTKVVERIRYTNKTSHELAVIAAHEFRPPKGIKLKPYCAPGAKEGGGGKGRHRGSTQGSQSCALS